MGTPPEKDHVVPTNTGTVSLMHPYLHNVIRIQLVATTLCTYMKHQY